MAEGFYDTGQANPVFRICRSKVPCGPQADANAGRDHCEPLGAAARGETLTLGALAGWPAPVAAADGQDSSCVAAPPTPARATNPARGRYLPKTQTRKPTGAAADGQAFPSSAGVRSRSRDDSTALEPQPLQGGTLAFVMHQHM